MSAQSIKEHEGRKYLRQIFSAEDGKASTWVDVYGVLEAFGVTCPARAHALKKLLCCGTRGKGDSLADLKGVLAAANRAYELEQIRLEQIMHLEPNETAQPVSFSGRCHECENIIPNCTCHKGKVHAKALSNAQFNELSGTQPGHTACREMDDRIVHMTNMSVEELFMELLAVIHRDGGHHLTVNGPAVSTAQGCEIVLAARKDYEELSEQYTKDVRSSAKDEEIAQLKRTVAGQDAALKQAATAIESNIKALDEVTPTGDAKYGIRHNELVNKVTGNAIPINEPLFIFRAQDKRAVHALEAYWDVCTDENHKEAVAERTADFVCWADENQDQMVEPTSAYYKADRVKMPEPTVQEAIEAAIPPAKSAPEPTLLPEEDIVVETIPFLFVQDDEQFRYKGEWYVKEIGVDFNAVNSDDPSNPAKAIGLQPTDAVDIPRSCWDCRMKDYRVETTWGQLPVGTQYCREGLYFIKTASGPSRAINGNQHCHIDRDSVFVRESTKLICEEKA